MILPFDIFHVEICGNIGWLESSATLEDAKARVQELAVRLPGEYFVLSQETGDKIVFGLDAVNGEPESKDLGLPIWQKPYQDALGERDPQKLSDKVPAAETAMFRRLQEIRNSSDGRSEIAAIHDALDALLVIKNEKLKSPGGNPKNDARCEPQPLNEITKSRDED